MIYVTSAFFLISVDFILREHVVAEQEQRRMLLDSGFRYGTAGKALTEKVGRMAAAFVGGIAPRSGIADTIERELREQAKDIKADILAEFLSRASTHSLLFEIERELDAAAFATQAPKPSELGPSAQAVLGVFADFCGIDRKRILV